MPSESVKHQRQVNGQDKRQNRLGVRAQSRQSQAEIARSLSARKVAKDQDSQEHDPQARVAELPAPNVKQNTRVNQQDFQATDDPRGKWGNRW